ncbi:MAG: hypothetical protein KF845_10425 [Cyclobacteriaceae bacterium]|nr:hypothetical protein [Cyclobacteriaceae bacterium]
MKVTHTKSNVIQYNEYYPFGLQSNTSWTRENHSNNYLYNEGSELNSTTGWYEMFYRGYDAALGRMFEIDPFASDFVSLSPYHYVGNNPALLTDPSGGSTPELRELTAQINTPGFFDVWIPGNGNFGPIGPGSGNHWSDGIGRSDWSANGGSESYRMELAFTNRYGGYQVGGSFYNLDGGRLGFENGQMRVWNPVGGALAYSVSYEEDGKLYVDQYYYGEWQTQNYSSSNDGLEKMSLLIGSASLGVDFYRDVMFDGETYIDMHGNRRNVFKHNKNGQLIIGKEGKPGPNSSKAANVISKAKGIKGFGFLLNGAGIFVTLVKINNEGFNRKNGTDLAMGLWAYTPGGWVLSGGYFLNSLAPDEIKFKSDPTIAWKVGNPNW